MRTFLPPMWSIPLSAEEASRLGLAGRGRNTRANRERLATVLRVISTFLRRSDVLSMAHLATIRRYSFESCLIQ